MFEIIGWIIFGIGAVIFWVARLQLLYRKGGLVTTGLYSVVRHPQFLGVLTICLGLSIALRSLPFLLILSLLTAVMIWRAKKEEKLLLAAFGDEYKKYMERTSFLLPLKLKKSRR